MRIGFLEPGTKRSKLNFNFSQALMLSHTKNMSRPRFMLCPSHGR